MSKIDQAAARIGMEPNEIRSVTDHECGTIIETVDGTKLIDLGDTDAGRPDLAFFGRPDGRDVDDPDAPAYALPVFRPPAAAHPADNKDDEAGDGLDELSVRELRAYATEHDIDLGDAKKKADIVAAIRAADAGPDEDEQDDAEDRDEVDDRVEHVGEPASVPARS